MLEGEYKTKFDVDIWLFSKNNEHVNKARALVKTSEKIHEKGKEEQEKIKSLVFPSQIYNDQENFGGAIVITLRVIDKHQRQSEDLTEKSLKEYVLYDTGMNYRFAGHIDTNPFWDLEEMGARRYEFDQEGKSQEHWLVGKFEKRKPLLDKNKPVPVVMGIAIHREAMNGEVEGAFILEGDILEGDIYIKFNISYNIDDWSYWNTRGVFQLEKGKFLSLLKTGKLKNILPRQEELAEVLKSVLETFRKEGGKTPINDFLRVSDIGTSIGQSAITELGVLAKKWKDNFWLHLVEGNPRAIDELCLPGKMGGEWEKIVKYNIRYTKARSKKEIKELSFLKCHGITTFLKSRLFIHKTNLGDILSTKWEGKFDVVCCVWVLFSIKGKIFSDTDLIEYLGRICKEDGAIILIEAHQNPTDYLEEEKELLTPERIAKYLKLLNQQDYSKIYKFVFDESYRFPRIILREGNDDIPEGIITTVFWKRKKTPEELKQELKEVVLAGPLTFEDIKDTFEDIKDNLVIHPPIRSELSLPEIVHEITSIEDLEALWTREDRSAFLKESSEEGVTSLTDFWDTICYEKAWNPTPTKLCEKRRDVDIWLISADSGNGKTMFLLTLAKLLLNSGSPYRIVFYPAEQFLEEKTVENFNEKHFIFVDLPSTSKMNELIETLKAAVSGKRNKSKVFITLYHEEADKVFTDLIQSDIRVERKNVDFAEDRMEMLQQTILKILRGWYIEFDGSFDDIHEVTKRILQKMNTLRCKQELLFFTSNLKNYRNTSKLLTKQCIAEFREPPDKAIRYLTKNVKDKKNFLEAFELFKAYYKLLKECYQQLGLFGVPLNVSQEGVAKLIGETKHVHNFSTILREAPILDSDQWLFYPFDEKGRGATAIDAYKGWLTFAYIPDEDEIKQIQEKTADMITKKEVSKNVGIYLDYLYQLICKNQLSSELESIIFKLKKYRNPLLWSHVRTFLDSTAFDLFKNNELDKSLYCFKLLLNVEPTDKRTWYNLGVLLQDQGKTKEAEQAYRKADIPNAWDNLGVLLLKQGKTKEAEQAYRKADTPNAYNNLGVLLQDQGKTKEAEQIYRKADTPNAWNNLGVLLQDQGKTKEAEQTYRKADTPNAWTNLGILLQNQGKTKEAEQAYRKANTPDAWTNLGVLLQDQGKTKEAEQTYRKADIPEAWYNLGNLLKNQGKTKEGEQAYRKANTPDAWTNLGVLLVNQGKTKEAEQAYRKANTPEAWNNLGVLLQDQRKSKEAEQAFRKADIPNAWTNLGVFLENQGKTKEAEQTYRKANTPEAWTYLGILLQDQGKTKEAEQAFRKADTPRHGLT